MIVILHFGARKARLGYVQYIIYVILLGAVSQKAESKMQKAEGRRQKAESRKSTFSGS
jgi:hypothetical protein